MRPRRPSAAALERLLAEAKAAAPTYSEIGATRGERLPAGYRHDRYERRVGLGDDVFERAVTALRAWQAQIGAGMEVVPEGARVGEEDTVLLLIRAGGLWATAPCCVIYVDEAPDCSAFAYGTLPEHAESGEERFLVEWDQASGEVRYDILAFSRPQQLVMWLGYPYMRRVQKRFGKESAAAMLRAVKLDPA